MIRPCGPEPLSAESSTPFCWAMRRASGLANTRPPCGPAAPFAFAPSPFAAAPDGAPPTSVGFCAFTEAPPPPPEEGCTGAPAVSATLSGCSSRMARGSEAEAPGVGWSAPVATGAGAAPPSSPSPFSRAMGALTFTPSEPAGTRIASSTPSSTASTSMVALSVSISAITWPASTVSPSLTSHLASVPSSMVGDRAGMRMSITARQPSR